MFYINIYNQENDLICKYQTKDKQDFSNWASSVTECIRDKAHEAIVITYDHHLNRVNTINVYLKNNSGNTERFKKKLIRKLSLNTFKDSVDDSKWRFLKRKVKITGVVKTTLESFLDQGNVLNDVLADIIHDRNLEQFPLCDLSYNKEQSVVYFTSYGKEKQSVRLFKDMEHTIVNGLF